MLNGPTDLQQDSLPILVQLATTDSGLALMIDSLDNGTALVRAVADLLGQAEISEGTVNLCVALLRRILSGAPQKVDTPSLISRISVWSLALDRVATLFYQRHSALKFTLLNCLCEALSAIPDDQTTMFDAWLRSGDVRLDPMSEKSTALLYRSLLRIKLAIMDIQRRNTDTYDAKDIGILLTAQLLRLLGEHFILPVGSPLLPWSLAAVDNIIKQDNESTDPLVEDTTQPAPDDVDGTPPRTNVEKFIPLAIGMAGVELRMLLDERLICPPGGALDELAAKRQEWLVPACLEILETGIRLLTLVEDDALPELPADISTLSPARWTEANRLTQLVCYVISRQSSEEILAWLIRLKDTFAATVEFLEEMMSRSGLENLARDLVGIAVFRVLCCWLSQDFSLLKDYPQMISIFGNIVQTSQSDLLSDSWEPILSLMIPPVHLWVSIIEDTEADQSTTPLEIISQSNRDEVLQMASILRKRFPDSAFHQ
ncbi:hypothetical protein BJ085DRAFT_28274 [Dimargaris cristalligena]|uniref:Neurochondrin-domain-containing protein n=1 Tax=Dimargaris cristalligena TaxID=215637 RepID=A0A4P9ZS74_9FUNG|nr:hypothetical protein BJ085DRAFT_28274 [Dimargaris cristalligena]|eukprot:RKP35641.1 hypothetical protein BJ085DRAFT_28274 [Dimargaris cristalligena]